MLPWKLAADHISTVQGMCGGVGDGDGPLGDGDFTGDGECVGDTLGDPPVGDGAFVGDGDPPVGDGVVVGEGEGGGTHFECTSMPLMVFLKADGSIATLPRSATASWYAPLPFPYSITRVQPALSLIDSTSFVVNLMCLFFLSHTL